MNISYNDLRLIFQIKGHAFFDSAPYDVNLYGIRTRKTDVVDEYNDILGIAFKDDFGNQINWQHRGTTKPGLYWLDDIRKGNVNGTAILIPGQYRRCWTLDVHRGSGKLAPYVALRQTGKFKVWRDKDMDGKFDYHGDVYDDVFGLNMHRNSGIADKDKVGAYSAGCQVRQNHNEHEAVMEILERSAEDFGDIFSYTLFEDHDFVPKTANA